MALLGSVELDTDTAHESLAVSTAALPDSVEAGTDANYLPGPIPLHLFSISLKNDAFAFSMFM